MLRLVLLAALGSLALGGKANEVRAYNDRPFDFNGDMTGLGLPGLGGRTTGHGAQDRQDEVAGTTREQREAQRLNDAQNAVAVVHAGQAGVHNSHGLYRNANPNDRGHTSEIIHSLWCSIEHIS
jgi:hypothetical protein